LEKQILAALALALVLAAAVAVYRGMEPGHQDDVAATEHQKTLERGALVYVEHCASCHGAYGEGTSTIDGPPVRGTQLTLNDVRRAVEQGTRAFPDTYHVYGRAGGGPLSDAQVEDVSFFIMNWDTQALDVARGAPVQVATELTDAGLDPAEMEMKAGELVRLVVANFASSGRTCRGEGLLGRLVAEEGAEATEQEVALEVAAGETKSLEFTPVSAGSYRFVCTPSEAGGAALEGTITVTR
jgi:mono/diheme cytochrome c family protein